MDINSILLDSLHLFDVPKKEETQGKKGINIIEFHFFWNTRTCIQGEVIALFYIECKIIYYVTFYVFRKRENGDNKINKDGKNKRKINNIQMYINDILSNYIIVGVCN